MDRDRILNGIHIGEHSFDPDNVINEIYERCVVPGLDFVTIRTRREQVPQHYFIRWAEYLAEHKIYFIFLYTIQKAPEGRESQFDPKTVAKMKEIAGEYFLGDMIGETGSSFACKFAGYYKLDGQPGKSSEPKLTLDYLDMEAAHRGYVESVSKYIEIDRKLGMPNVVSVEATGLNKYNAEAGVTIPMLELMCGNPEILVSSLRGVARATGAKQWGTYVAHEWYGGMRHDDILKRKRLDLVYKYAYMAGTNVLCLESGDEVVSSYGHRFEPESEVCGDYRRALTDTMKLIQTDARPKGGPKVKVAFVSGLHDAWGGWGGSSVWNQFFREEWGHGEAEHSWRLLDEVGKKRSWEDIANFGEQDLSALPAYGMYDIVPIEAPLEELSRYDYLIFVGWNSMTDENMDKLTEYVSRGGHLLMSAAHLNYQTARDGELILPSNDRLERLFGARFTGDICRTNDGVKFKYEALNDQLSYPGSKSLRCDPIYSAGYQSFARFELTDAYETAFVSGSFRNDPSDLPAVIEHRLGNGIATLVTSVNYPGYPATYPLYRAIVREMITASARACEVKVIGSDRVRYAVYEGNKIYLLNTDYDLPVTVKVVCGDHAQMVTLGSLELKIIADSFKTKGF